MTGEFQRANAGYHVLVVYENGDHELIQRINAQVARTRFNGFKKCEDVTYVHYGRIDANGMAKDDVWHKSKGHGKQQYRKPMGNRLKRGVLAVPESL